MHLLDSSSHQQSCNPLERTWLAHVHMHAAAGRLQRSRKLLHMQLAHLNFLKAQAATFSRLSRASSSAKTGIIKRIVRLSWYSPL